ncbi:MAG: DNA replication/repair protein RecF [Clostridia bacterium]|nr:DNA replication/repair protein RecF [Clostridia bacterium]
MFVRKLTVNGFRNLHPTQFEPCEGVNILAGNNAQGKTNLLEACWLFTGARSFRGAKDREMVAFGEQCAKLALDFTANGRNQRADIRIEQRRSVTLNGVKLPSAARLAGTFCGVVFSPSHLSLIKDGPEGRRRFVDSAYCQLHPAYVGTLAEHAKILTQRNAFLRQASEQRTTYAEKMLSLWDHSLAVASARLTAARCRYIQKLQPLAAKIYDGLSGGREQLTLEWESVAYKEDASSAQIAANWANTFAAARAADLAAGFSTQGAHREDMIIRLDGVPARVYGSQGQQRSAVLALKLAEATLLQEISGEQPVAFLDDVMSELDVSRQDYILNHIEGWQVFITCCEPTAALRMNAGKVFEINGGRIVNIG